MSDGWMPLKEALKLEEQIVANLLERRQRARQAEADCWRTDCDCEPYQPITSEAAYHQSMIADD